VSPPAIEVELAVARNREYLVRTVFRGPEPISIGTNPRAAITLPDDRLPDYFELVHLSDGRARLAFESGMDVEWKIDGALRPSAELIAGGFAVEGADVYELEVTAGGKGLIKFGELRVLLKVQEQRDLTIWSATNDEGACCGGCGASLKWALAGAGALSPCQRCGDLNRVESSIADLEQGTTRAVPTYGGSEPATAPPQAPIPVRSGPIPAPPPEPPTLGGPDVRAPTLQAPSIGGPDVATGPSGDLPTYDGIQGPRGADLPTFDGIQVGVQAEAPSAVALLAAERARPPRDMGPGHGANLPTFDAISVFKGEADLSTRAAISVMKGAEDGEPPVLGTADGVEVSPAPARLGPADAVPEEATEEAAAQLPSEAPIAAAPVAAAPAPSDESQTRPHKYPPPERETAPIVTSLPAGAASSGPAPSSISDLPEAALESAPLLRTQGIGVDDDDFLRGRHEGGPRTQMWILGWLLIGGGLMAGLAGMGLMVFAAARYKGLL